MSKREKLIRWCRKRTEGYRGVDIRDLNKSWSDGLAFCALVNSIDCTALNFNKLSSSNPAKNLQIAFDAAEIQLAVPALLDVEDVLDEETPDDVIIMTYLIEFTKKYATAPIQGGSSVGVEPEMPTPEEIEMFKQEKEAQRKRKEELIKKKLQRSLKKEKSKYNPKKEEEMRRKRRELVKSQKPGRKLPPPPKIRMVNKNAKVNDHDDDGLDAESIQRGIKKIGDNLADDSCSIL